MKFIASIDIMPHKELLDPQGKAVAKSMKNLELNAIEDVRIGKHIELQVEADSEDAARTQVQTACEKLLANPIMEHFEFELAKA
ncbi:MAG: phosphoribosylformylglycinamidine synthase PurS subunit [Limisphaerales bacterium]|jgi:phosphoribosylformylglycinamidine synthase PurS subunit